MEDARGSEAQGSPLTGNCHFSLKVLCEMQRHALDFFRWLRNK